MITRQELLHIGQLTKPHGIHGELSLTFLQPTYIHEWEFIVCEMDGLYVPFFIKGQRSKGSSTVLVQLEGIENEVQASEFTGKEVFLTKKQLDVIANDDDEDREVGLDYYIGFSVTDIEFGEIGVIVDIDDSTTNTLFIIETEEGDEVLIPANDELVIDIDFEKEIITMDLPQGLI